MIIVGIVVLVVARLIGTTQFHQLAYVLFLLPLSSLILGYLSSRGVKFSRRLPLADRLAVGKSARIDLLLANESHLDTSRAGVLDRLPEPREFDAPPLKKGGGTMLEVPVTFARRGVYELGPAEVRVVDPFELLRFSRKFDERTEIVVYPRVHELPGFPLRGGNTESGSRGPRGQRGDEFAGLREYRRGDDQRHIHWKSVARTGELFVKEFALEAPRRYTVALDLRRTGLRAQEAEVEDAVSAAASVLAHVYDQRLPVRLLCTDGAEQNTEFGNDEASRWRAMRILAMVKADGDRPFGEAVLKERSSLGEGVVLISRAKDEELPVCVRRLRDSGLSVAVVALAPHTYRGYPGPRESEREAEFMNEVGRLEAAGAVVRVIRHPEGVAGLSEGESPGMRSRGAVS